MADALKNARRVTLFRGLKEEGWVSMDVYAQNLLAALQSIHESDLVAHLYTPRYLPLIDWAQPLLKRIPRVRVLARDLYLSRYVLYPALARFHQGEVNHILDHSYAHLLRALRKDRTVVTCHDLMPLRLAPRETWHRNIFLRMFLYSVKVLGEAACVIADSEATKRDLIELLELPEEKIVVIHIGVAPVFRDDPSLECIQYVREKYRLARLEGYRAILHVGSAMRYKNIEEIIRALSLLLPEHPDLRFVRAGQWLTDSQRALAMELGVADAIIELGPIPTAEELAAIYREMDLLAFPSAHEGFGLPVVEAFASGLPVVASNKGSLPEVSGGAALCVEPTPERLADAFLQVLGRSDLQARLISAGRERARSFDWGETARRTADVYDAVLTEAGRASRKR